jgi:hypothetical protein
MSISEKLESRLKTGTHGLEDRLIFFKIGIPLTIVVGVVSVLLNFPLPAYDFPN